jgi:UDP-3-O-[3-hydroxymyristoyl] glucosamine N-acyltransferase
MRLSVSEIAQAIGARIVGDGRVEIAGVASLSRAQATDLIFIEEERHLRSALDSQAAVVIAPEFAEGVEAPKVLVITRYPRLAFARAARLLAERSRAAARIDPAAHVHPTAKLGQGVRIEASASVGEHTVIGKGSVIGAGAVLGAEVEIGEDCRIYPNVTIYAGTRLGGRVVVHAGAVLGSDGFGYVRDPESGRLEKFPQIGGLEIAHDVEIGANATVDRGALEVTRIGAGTKIDNLVHIGHNCRIGENVVIAAQVGFSGSITVENDVVIGGQVGVGEHARIGEGVQLGGQSGVLPKKIVRGRGVRFWGTPARPLRQYLKQIALLGELGKNKR